MVTEVMHTHLRHEGGYKFNITFDEMGGRLHSDEPKPLGREEGFTAEMLLNSAVGHCLTSSLVFCMEKSRVPVKDVEADLVTTLKRNEKGRWRVDAIKVNLRVNVDDKDKDKFERCRGMFQDFCIVSTSIREGVKIDVEAELMQ